MSCSKRVRVVETHISTTLHSTTYLPLILYFFDLPQIGRTINILSSYHSKFLFTKTNKILLKRLISRFYKATIFSMKQVIQLFDSDIWQHRQLLISKLFNYPSNLKFLSLQLDSFIKVNTAKGLIYWVKENKMKDYVHMLINCDEWTLGEFKKILNYIIYNSNFNFNLLDIFKLSNQLLSKYQVQHYEYFLQILLFSVKICKDYEHNNELRLNFIELIVNYINILTNSDNKMNIDFETFKHGLVILDEKGDLLKVLVGLFYDYVSDYYKLTIGCAGAINHLTNISFSKSLRLTRNIHEIMTK